MRLSAKGRYALATTIKMGKDYENEKNVTVISISEKLGISKIYLEQVFSLLKRGGLVNSIKGSQGGYHLARMPKQITVFDILSAVEISLFESPDKTVFEKAPEIETAMQLSAFNVLDEAIKNILEKITLYDLITEAEKHKEGYGTMFYI